MSPEPRRHLPVPLRVELRLGRDETRVEYAVNLSPGGLCLHGREPLPADRPLRVVFDLPGEEDLRVEAVASVVWTSRGALAAGEEVFCETGLRFERLDPAARARLASFASEPVDRRR